MTNQIPEAAVKAATKVVWEMDDDLQSHEYAKEIARAALEAAAPHMLAQGATAGDLDSLPIGSIVLDAWGIDWRKTSKGIDGDNWDSSTTAWPHKVDDIELPAQVIYTESVK